LADTAGVAVSTVTRIEKGEMNPTVAMLERLLDAAGADLLITLRPREIAAAPTLSAVRRHAPEIRTIAARHGGSHVRVVGSVARGEARPGSDVDLLLDVAPGTGLFEIAQMEDELSEALPWRVDVVTSGAVRGAMAHIDDDAVAL
jgi:predicted nucleotidyltransferase